MSTEVEIKRSVCHWCHNKCRVEVYIRDGRLEKMEEDKTHPRAERLRTVVRSCTRARAAAEWYYHPDRLTFPLKRAGEKGEGKWQQISWEQALDEIARKIKEFKAKYGAETLATTSGTGRTDDEFRIRFFNLFGSPNNIGQGQICYGPGQVVSAAMYGWPDLFPAVGSATKCVMLIGNNPEQSRRDQWIALLDALRRGLKLIVIDPRRIVPAKRANLWLQLRPGTDTALLMAMIDTIIQDELYDKDFVDKWCYGFDKLKERAREYPPEKAAQITGVPAEKIREAARMYATNKPAVIYHAMGVEHLPNSIQALQARYILTAITGNLDIRGGEELRGPHPKLVARHTLDLNEKMPPEQAKKQIGADRFKLQSWPGFELLMEHVKIKWGRSDTWFAHAPSVYRAILTGKPYPVRALITLASNPMVTQANTKLVYKAIKSLDLYAVVDYWRTPSAELADYVLPAAMWLERPVIFNYWDVASYIDAGEAVMPARVEGKHDRRTDYEFWRGLAVRLGQEEYWLWKTLEETYDYKIKPLGYSSFAEFVQKTGGIDHPPKEERKYEKVGFGTETKKVELYSKVLEKLGYDPLPRFEEPAESPLTNPKQAKEYPFVLITGGRHLPFFHSEHRQIDSLRREHPYPLVQIHPETAQKLGIFEGDWVWIETPRGRVRQKCQYFSGIDPRVVHAQHGWWYPELPGEEPWLHGVWESNINVVTDDEPDHCNPINGGWPLRTLMCTIYKAKTY